jgi:hypothetical protein
MAVTLSLFAGAGAQFFDNNGNVLSGGKIYTYQAGTTTPLATYTANSESAFHTNPIILDSAGRVPSGGEIWLQLGVGYKFVLRTSAEVLIATYDNIPSSAQPPAANDADSIMYEQGYTVTAGSFVVGKIYRIASVGTTNFTLIGATSNTIGTHFIATGVGTGTGTAELSQTVETKLRESVSVKDFGAVGDGVTDDTAAIQAAINTGKKAIVPFGIYRVTQPIVIGADKALHLEKGVEIFGDMASPMPVIRVAGNFATLTGDGWPVVRTDHQTGWLPSSLNEGVINIGPAVTSGAANINWAMVDGIRVQGNASVYSQYAAGTNTDIDKYVGIKMVHGRYVYGAASTSLYNITVQNCMIQDVGVGVDMDPVVQGNNFINNYFYQVSFAGYRTRGCGENSYSHGFFHSSRGVSFFRFESVPLRIANVVGVFVGSDVVTGASSGATLTLFPNFPFDQTEGGLYGVDVGNFIVGETLTGSISGATAVVSTTRQQYVDGSLGRTSLGNTAIGIIGEPGATALIGTQNAGPIGGRYSRFYTVLDANTGNYFQGRGNTGHAVLDYAGSNTLLEQGTITSDRPARFTDLDVTSVKIDSTVSGWKSAIGNATNLVIVPHEIVALNKKRYVFDCTPVTVGQNMRLTFSKAANITRVCMITVKVAGGWFASSSSNRHVAAEYIFRISGTNAGNSTIEGPTPVFEYGFDYTTDFTFTSGAGTGAFTVDLLNPVADAAASSNYYFEVEILGPDFLLNTITLV